MKKLITGVLTCLSLGAFGQGTAMEFDGVDDFITTDYSGFTTSGSRTIEAWIKASYDSQQRFIVDMGSLTGPGSRFSFKINPGDNNIRIEVGGGGLTGTVNVTDNAWHHVAVTYDNAAATNKYKLYVDGVLDTEGDISTALNTVPGGDLMIGCRTDSSSSTMFDGSIDEVRIYDGVRTVTELQASMNNEFCVLPSSLVAYYKLNDGVAGASNISVTTVLDEVNTSGTNNISAGFSLSGSTSNFITGTVNGAASNSSITVTSCGDYISPDNNTYTTTGIYTDTIAGAFCDSVITIDLTIPVLSTSLSNVGGTLTALETGVDYQWIDCDNSNAPISGEVSQSFSPTADGNYAVVLTNGACSDTSACTSFTLSTTVSQNNAAMHFDGVNDKIETNSPGIQGDNAVTVEAWVKTEALNNEQIITTWGDESYNGGRFTFRLNNVAGAYVARVEIKGGGINGAVDLNDGMWHHVAVSYDPNATSNAYKLFVDGVLDTEGDITQTLNIGSAQNILISKRINPSFGGYFSGEIDEIKVWNVAKTAAELVAGMNNELCNLTSDLVMYYNFNEGIIDGDNTALSTSPDYSLNSTPGALVNLALNGTSSNYVSGAPVAAGLNASFMQVENCIDYTWSENATTYTSSGLYFETLSNVNSCDSLVVLNLEIITPDVVTETVSSCLDYTWAANGTTYTSSGQYTEVLQNIFGCDSTVTLDLTIGQPATGIDQITNCGSYTWIDGQTYTVSNNTATHTLTSATGCDSIVTLDLTVFNVDMVTEDVVNCGAYTWGATGTQYLFSGTHTATLQNVNGCDSVVTLNLTINPDFNLTENVEACDSYTWSANGTTYTNSGVFTENLQTINGCDSVVTLDLTIGQNVTSSISETSCGAFTWNADGNEYASSGIYTAIIPSVTGCDSTITLDLTVVDLDNGVVDNVDGTFSAQDADANTLYQWLDCDNNYMPIASENDIDFTPVNNGSYAVEVTNGTCIDTSMCLIIDNVGLVENDQNVFAIYPNPSNGLFTLSFSSSAQGGQIVIVNVQGQVVYLNRFDTVEELKVDLSEEAKGVFFIKLINHSGTSIQKLVLN